MIAATQTTPVSTRPTCFQTEDHVSLVLHLADGTIRGWPLHLLNGWSLAAANNRQLLIVQVANVTITVSGFRLGEIATELATCKAGIDLTELDARFEALVGRERPYIFAIAVDDAP